MQLSMNEMHFIREEPPHHRGCSESFPTEQWCLKPNVLSNKTMVFPDSRFGFGHGDYKAAIILHVYSP